MLLLYMIGHHTKQSLQGATIRETGGTWVFDSIVFLKNALTLSFFSRLSMNQILSPDDLGVLSS